MLTALGWILGIVAIVVFIGWIVLKVLIAWHEAGKQSSPLTTIRGGDSYNAFDEGWKRLDRSHQLDHLKWDLKDAERLMKLEEKAHDLKRRYDQRSLKGSSYSAEVEEAIRRIFDEVEELKRGGVS